jgi:hypothetical protein
MALSQPQEKTMRSKILSLLALSLLPGAALAQDYPYTSSSSNTEFMLLNNTGSTDKTMLTIWGNTPNGVGVTTWSGNWSAYGYALAYDAQSMAGDYGQTIGILTEALAGDASTNRGAELYASGGMNSVNYGIQVQSNGGDYSDRYGIYATVNNYGYYGGFNAAGYFAGDVYADNYYYTSDRKFKKDIQDLHGGLSTVMALKPRSYTMRKDEFKGKMAFSDGKKLGFIAQELETVLPELVKDAVAPAILTKEEREAKVKKDPTQYKSVDYVGVIPVLVAAIQEQQALIKALTDKVAALEAGK